jgi:hypothetical protein
MKKIIPVLFVLLIHTSLQGQDTLPKFSVRNLGNNRVLISWVNTYQNIRQISIQRSSDSLKNFQTILTVPDPTTAENGFVDGKAPHSNMYYRIYIQMERGVYFFTAVKKPFLDSLTVLKKVKIEGATGKMKTADTLAGPSIVLKEKEKGNVFIASKYVFTLADGYVRLNLPEDAAKKYSIKFFDDKEKPLFEIKEIRPRNAKIDKANFYHAGWFRFELYESGKLVEKNKFFISKEF